MSLIEENFITHARRTTPRVLTQMDRDPMSPTFGCFDRDYWHYKIRDFPSSILQQSVFVLESIQRGSIDISFPEGFIESWMVGAIRALARQIRSNGSVDEYYPYERSFPAAAFSLYAISSVLWRWPSENPPPLEYQDWEKLRHLTKWLASHTETEASNQQAAGLAAIAIATHLPDLNIHFKEYHTLSEQFFSTQHAEGWFPEYGGPDFGYLSVTIDGLIDFYDATGDERAVSAIDAAVAFMTQLIGADGHLPWTINSRNTDYVVPYGLVRAASRNAEAAWLVHQLFNGINANDHFMNAIDDRYNCHYIFSSLVRAIPHLKNMLPAKAPTLPEHAWFEGCGYWIRRTQNRKVTVFFSANKGGLVRVHRKGKAPIIDSGWRVIRKTKIWTNNWWTNKWVSKVTSERAAVSGSMQHVRYFSPYPLMHVLLRATSFLTFGQVIKFLKYLMIFRKHTTSGPRYSRQVHFSQYHLEIIDKIHPSQGTVAKKSPRQNLRHVASADSYSEEELTQGSALNESISLNKGLNMRYMWKFEE